MTRRLSLLSMLQGFGIGLVFFYMMLPLLGRGFIGTDDGHWMIIRLTAFYQSLREGQFPVRFLGRLNYEYGYPVANFLYPGFMYIGSFIRAFGVSFIDTVKILLIGAIGVSVYFLWRWLRLFYGRFPSMLGAIGFLTAPYLSYDLYKRGSVGEILSFAWVALLLFAIESGRKTPAALATALLIVSHNSTAALFIPIILVYLWVTGRLRIFAISIGLGFGLSTFFWFPALLERRFVVFDRTNVSDPSAYFVTLPSLWLVGLPGILAALIGWKEKVGGVLKPAMFAILSISVLLALPVSAALWDVRVFSKLFQFPFRMLAVGLFLGPWFISMFVARAGAKRAFVSVLMLIGFGAQIILGRQYVTVVYLPEEFFTTNEATTTVADEYMPRWVGQKPRVRAAKRAEFYKGRGVITTRNSGLHPIDVSVEAEEDSIIQLNSHYYPGWGVVVDNTPVAIDYDNPLGVMRVIVPKGNHRVTASFRETVPRFLADFISVASGVALLGFAFVHKFVRARRKTP